MSKRRLALHCVALTALAGFVASEALAQRQPRPDAQQQQPQQDNAVPQPQQEAQFPLGAAWTLVSLNGRPVGGDRPSMVLDESLRISGFGGCNTYSATAYPLREKGFVVGPIAVTRRACESGASTMERSYLQALRAARRWDLQQGRLVLSGGAGELRFERAL